MTIEEAINHIKYGLIENNYPLPKELGIEVLQMAIEALKMVDDFERAQIITGGRLNGRTYAYKRGLEDGKRKALEQAPDIDKVIATIDFEEKWLLDAGYNCSNVNTAFRSIKHDLRKLGGK
jgi:hypothetical protein